MIIFLYGPDTFRSGQKLKAIVEQYKAKHKSGLNLTQLDWDSGALTKLKDIFSSASMFNEKKLAIIKNACFGPKDEQEILIELLDEKKLNEAKDIVAVFFEADRPQKSVLAEWLTKKTKMAQAFDWLTGVKLNNWIKKEVANLGGQISVEAIQKLAAGVGSDLWQMQNELKKLVNFRAAKLITPEDVDLMIKPKIDQNIFVTIDALANRNKNLAYKLLHQHLSQGENEIYLLTMFVFQFRNLLQIKSLIDLGESPAAIAKKTGLPPFVIKKSWGQVKNFSLDILKKIYERLMHLDIAVRRGRIEPQVALDLIVAEISG